MEIPARSHGARRSDCPISVALDLLGDPWSLLIVRDLMFKGLRTFGEFETAGEGIATNILADRLRRLEAGGILIGRSDPHDKRRLAYRLTEKGMDLVPTLVELVLWSARHEDTAAPAPTVRKMRFQRRSFLAELRRKWAASN